MRVAGSAGEDQPRGSDRKVVPSGWPVKTVSISGRKSGDETCSLVTAENGVVFGWLAGRGPIPSPRGYGIKRAAIYRRVCKNRRQTSADEKHPGSA
jgi:hypothetical protein